MLLDERGKKNADTPHSQRGLMSMNPNPNHQEWDSVFFKNDRIYCHKLARFNYTTYDVRRAQDVINPMTSHCNILLLAHKNGGNPAEHDHMLASLGSITPTWFSQGRACWTTKRE